MTPDHAHGPTREDLARWLKAQREDAGCTQYAAAQAIGTTVTSISRWETATHPISAEDLIALLLLYDAVDAFARFIERHGARRGARK